MKFVKIKEGETEVLVPEHEKGPGPKCTDAPIFYNPAMEINRDTSISFLKAVGCRDMKILDGMAATGVRGIRIANELNTEKVVLTDISKESVDLIRKNAEYLDIEVYNESVESHLLVNRYRYDYVDIDPFGTPVPYLPTALRYIRQNGIIAVSATDTSVLCGTYPKKCKRIYSASPSNNWCRHENGLRILIGHIVREAARYDRGVIPLLSYYDGHHFRTYLRIKSGAGKANDALDKIKTYRFSEIEWHVGGETGPLWNGRITSQKIVDSMEPLGTLTEDTLELWKNEAEMPPFFYDTSVVGKHLKISPPPLKEVITVIRSAGYKATRTHFSPTAFKTDATTEVVLKAF